MSDHVLRGTVCSCGKWQALLGTSIRREFDKHLLEVQAEFRETDPILDEASALPAFMTIVLLFGAAMKGATKMQKDRLRDAHAMLRDRKPLPEVAQAILDARGEDWAPDPETLAYIEALHKESTP